jgi:hypothetical protein
MGIYFCKQNNKKIFSKNPFIIHFGARHNENIIQKLWTQIVNSSQSLLLGAVIQASA